ncbi:MAG: hypothetical protein WC575_00685 [Patescibacteria group bacterium]
MASPTQTKKLLWEIIQLITRGLTIAVEMRRYQTIYLSGGGHEQVLDIKRRMEFKNLRNKIYQLKRTRYLVTKKIGNRLMVSLTAKGKKELLKYKISSALPYKDNLSTMVIFDIPEQARQGRDYFRNFLRENNFKQIQKSVWFSKQNVTQPLNDFLKYYRLTDWVKVFEARTIK